MPPPEASRTLYQQVQTYQLALLTIGRRLWRRIVPGDIDGSWQRVAPQLVAYTAGAQLAAARSAVAYVPAVLEETGQPDEPDAAIRPEAFSGTAFDGRPLDAMLEGATRTAKARIGAGVDPAEALVGGQSWLEMALQTAVADAARDANAAMIAVRGGMGWTRMVNAPCCSRCAVLAGRWYRWSEGFLRHPRCCDCTHIPATEDRADDFRTDPQQLADRGLITDLTPAQRQRLDDGANLVKVLNESRDAWRQRMAVERKAEKARQKRLRTPTGWGGTDTPGGGGAMPDGGIQNWLDGLASRTDAIRQMKAHGIAE